MSEGPSPKSGIPIGNRRRPAAGHDPVKRRQILDGADRVFSETGFDAASMNDIAKAAGVSKATLYVYFEDKEHLFVAPIAEKRVRYMEGLHELLTEDDDVAVVLTRLGERLVMENNTEWALRAQRIVLGVAERMPEVGRLFFEEGAMRIANDLAAYLERRVADGRLVLPHALFASAQFLELCQATITRPRLFRAVTQPPAEAEVRLIVRGAVAMFMAAYGTANTTRSDRHTC